MPNLIEHQTPAERVGARRTPAVVVEGLKRENAQLRETFGSDRHCDRKARPKSTCSRPETARGRKGPNGS